MFYQLPPVGNPVALDRSKVLSDVGVLSSYQTQFYASGTAALAAALVAVLENSQSSVNSAQPEVIFPAYGCPDLIAAALLAGVKPVLVDLEAERPWLDLSALDMAITENTVAIVAVNLFGISERWPQLRKLAINYEILLIEDSAQYFPNENNSQAWQGDLVVLSFGRGKPVSLLGGGAVLTKNGDLYKHLPARSVLKLTFQQSLLLRIKIKLYNAMISPSLYWIPKSLPFLHLGETRYHPLSSLEGIDSERLDMLASNIFHYQSDCKAANRHRKISLMLEMLDGVNNLPKTCDSKENHRLLRYPLLVGTSLRDAIYQKLNQSGLGASTLYPTVIPKISGIEFLKDSELHYPNAEAFAASLITIPMHNGLGDKEIEKISCILKEYIGINCK